MTAALAVGLLSVLVVACVSTGSATPLSTSRTWMPDSAGRTLRGQRELRGRPVRGYLAPRVMMTPSGRRLVARTGRR